MCLLCTCYEYNYLFLCHHNLILCILYKCHMGCIKGCSIIYVYVTRSHGKMAVHGSMGEVCLQHYCRANDVFDDGSFM